MTINVENAPRIPFRRTWPPHRGDGWRSVGFFPRPCHQASFPPRRPTALRVGRRNDCRNRRRHLGCAAVKSRVDTGRDRAWSCHVRPCIHENALYPAKAVPHGSPPMPGHQHILPLERTYSSCMSVSKTAHESACGAACNRSNPRSNEARRVDPCPVTPPSRSPRKKARRSTTRKPVRTFLA